MHVLNEQLQFNLVVDWFTANAKMLPWTTKSVLSRTHIFVAIANNAL